MIETGMYFDNIHSFYDLNLILSGLEIPPAKPKTSYIDVLGADGSIDLTEAIGEVKYYDRDCKFIFTMNPSGDLSESAWEEKKTEVSNLLAGKAFKITLDKDDDFYYKGRCTVDEFLSDKRIRQIVVTAKVNPYKYKQTETYITYELNSTARTIIINNARKTVSPIIECTNDNTTVKFGDTTYFLNAGRHLPTMETTLLDIRFTMGSNQLEISGTGKITFIFQEGEL